MAGSDGRLAHLGAVLINQNQLAVELGDFLRQPQDSALAGGHMQLGVGYAAVLRGEQQAIAAEERGPSWEVKAEDLELTGEVIGTGGWAEVRVAHLKVAAKNLHRQLVYDYHHQLFQREMAVAARVSHPNLLRFHGAKLEGGMTILTEFMPTSLRDEGDRGHSHPDHRLSPEQFFLLLVGVPFPS